MSVENLTSLVLAIRADDVAKCSSLLKLEPSLVGATVDNNLTPLMIAAKEGSAPIIECLVDAGADVNGTNTEGYNAAHISTMAGNIKNLRQLVRSGANISNEGGVGTLLHSAVQTGDSRFVGVVLYEFDAPLNAKDSTGATALLKATMGGNTGVMQFLLEHGADPNLSTSGGASPLHIAASKGGVDDIKLLVAFGARTDILDSEGRTPLELAKQRVNGSAAIVKELGKPLKSSSARTDDAARFKAHGNRVFSEGENVKAAKFYSQAIQNENLNHVYFSNRAACYFNLTEYLAAFTDGCRCITLNPSFARGYFRKAAAQQALKDFEGAKKTVNSGLAIEPHNKDLLRLLDQLSKS